MRNIEEQDRAEEKAKNKKPLIVLVVSFLFFYYWFSNWHAFEQFVKCLFN
jgi:hypothetical protein